MSLFSECFFKLKDRRNLTAAQIAEKCGKDKSHIFYWQTGKKTPSTWKSLEKIIEYMQLFPEEIAQLRSSYERTKYGENVYSCYKNFFGMLDVLQQSRDAYGIELKKTDTEHFIKDFPDVLRMNNKFEIISTLQRLLEGLEGKETKKLHIKTGILQPEISMLLKLFCGKVPDCQIVLIVCLGDFKEESEGKILEIWKNALELMMQKNQVEVYLTEVSGEKQELDVNWILSEEFAIQVDENYTHGILHTQPEWITFFQMAFGKLQQESKLLEEKNPFMEDSIFENEVIITGSSMSYLPDFSKMDKNICWESYFCMDGLIQFMETGVADNFSFKKNSPLTLKERISVLENMIRCMEQKNGKQRYYILRDPIDLQSICLEQAESPKAYFSTRIFMGDGDDKHYMVQEEWFQRKFQEFLLYLKEEEYVYGEKESLWMMKEVLKKCRKK